MGLSSDVRVCEHIHLSIDYLWLSINCHVKQTLGTYSLCGDREMVTKFIWPIHLEAHKLLRNARNFFINQCLLVMKNSWHLDMIHFLTEHLKHSIFRIIQILDICTCISITSYGFLSVFEIDEDSLHNFNTYLLLSAKLQHMADLSVTNYWDKGTPSSIITCAKFQSVIHACIHKWSCVAKWFKSLWFYVLIY